MSHFTSPFVSEAEIGEDFDFEVKHSPPALRLLSTDEASDYERGPHLNENPDEMSDDGGIRGGDNPDEFAEHGWAENGLDEQDEAIFIDKELDNSLETANESPSPAKPRKIERKTRWVWRNKVDQAVRKQFKLKGSSLQSRVRYYSKKDFAKKFPGSAIPNVLLKLFLLPNLTISNILFAHGKVFSHDPSGVTPKQRVRSTKQLIAERVKAGSFLYRVTKTKKIPPRELIADSVQGFTTSRSARSNRRVIMQLPATVETLAHEACHFYAHWRFNSLSAKKAQDKFLGGLRVEDILYEGFAEYFARQVMRDHAEKLGPLGRTEYKVYVRAAERIIATIGEATARAAYFRGDKQALTKLFKSVDANIKYYPLLVPGFVIDREAGLQSGFDDELEQETADTDEGSVFENLHEDHAYDIDESLEENESWEDQEFDNELDDMQLQESDPARQDYEQEVDAQDQFEIIGEAFQSPGHPVARESDGVRYDPDEEFSHDLTEAEAEAEADDLLESESGSRRRKYDRMLRIALRNLDPVDFNAPWKKATAADSSIGKYDSKYWEIVTDTNPGYYLDRNNKWRRHNWDMLEIRDDRKAFEAVRSLIWREDRWTFECASFIQAVHLYALARSRGRRRFLRYFATKKLHLRYHWSPGLITLKNHRKDAPDKPWRVTTSAGKTEDTISVPDLLKQTPYGSRVMWHNVKGEGAWKNENTVKVGDDRYRGFPLFESRPVKGWKIQMGLAAHQVYKIDKTMLDRILDDIDKASGTDVVNNSTLQSLWQYTQKNVYLREVQTIGPDPAM